MLPKYLATLVKIVVICTFSYTSGFAATQACLFSPKFPDVLVRTISGESEHWPNYSLINVIEPLNDLRFVKIQLVDSGAFASVKKNYIQDLSLCTDNNVLSPLSVEPSVADNFDKPFSDNTVNNGNKSNIDPFLCSQNNASAALIESCNRKNLFEFSVKNRRTLGYNGARIQMFQYVDAQINKNGEKTVDSVYSDDVLEFHESGIPGGNFNTEHTWPQSKLKNYPNFNDSRADLYHLFPVETRINGKRGNLPFTECDGEPSASDGRVPEFCNDSFEPPEQHKGFVARAMLYISLSYNIPLDDDQEKVIRIWNKEFPPTAQEIERASRIYKAQGNENPFVAHPEYADLLSDF